MSRSKRPPKKPRFKPNRTKTDGSVEAVEVSMRRSGNTTFAITKNLLHNFVVRDSVPINESFDNHYGSKLGETDKLVSEAAFLFFVATREDTGLHEDYRTVLTGLLQNALNTFGGSVILLRNGLPGQSMVLIRQVVEICATILHIGGDPKRQAIKDFQDDKYGSTDAIGQAKKAVPIIGMFWGFLSNAFVHINRSHSQIEPVRPYQAGNADVDAVLTCLRMTSWICYITAEFAFPGVLEKNRYWKLQVVDGRNAASYEPDEQERRWAAQFLDLKNVGPDDLGDENTAATDGRDLDSEKAKD